MSDLTMLALSNFKAHNANYRGAASFARALLS